LLKSISVIRRAKVQIIDLITEYTRLREELEEILKVYGVSSSGELLQLIEDGKVSEHPAYEDYLEAKSIEKDLESIRAKLKKLIEEI